MSDLSTSNLSHYPLSNTGCNDASKINRNYVDLINGVNSALSGVGGLQSDLYNPALTTAVVSVNASNEVTVGDLTNNTLFEADGTMVMNGDATTYDDIVLFFDAAKVPASNAPTWTSFIGNLNAYTFGVNDLLEAKAELTHSYKEGSEIEFHVHWVTNGTNASTRTVKWEIEYTIANYNSTGGSTYDATAVFPSTTTISYEALISSITTDRTHFFTSINTATMTDIGIGAYIVLRIRRVAGVGTAPANDPFGLAIGIHFEQDTSGSRTVTTK